MKNVIVSIVIGAAVIGGFFTVKSLEKIEQG